MFSGSSCSLETESRKYRELLNKKEMHEDCSTCSRSTETGGGGGGCREVLRLWIAIHFSRSPFLT